MSQFRSEEMNLVQLFVQSDAAHETLHELGQIGAIQFKDVSVTPSAAGDNCPCPLPDALVRSGSLTRTRRRSSEFSCRTCASARTCCA